MIVDMATEKNIGPLKPSDIDAYEAKGKLDAADADAVWHRLIKK